MLFHRVATVGHIVVSTSLLTSTSQQALNLICMLHDTLNYKYLTKTMFFKYKFHNIHSLTKYSTFYGFILNEKNITRFLIAFLITFDKMNA